MKKESLGSIRERGTLDSRVDIVLRGICVGSVFHNLEGPMGGASDSASIH